jgi:histidinol-phosphate aminotransferase
MSPGTLNARLENDLPALSASVVGKTQALYLINPHNPTGTVTGSTLLLL